MDAHQTKNVRDVEYNNTCSSHKKVQAKLFIRVSCLCLFDKRCLQLATCNPLTCNLQPATCNSKTIFYEKYNQKEKTSAPLEDSNRNVCWGNV